MSSKHTKAGRRARRRAHHTEIAREAWGAYQGRRAVEWLMAQMRASSSPVIRGEVAHVRSVALSGVAWARAKARAAGAASW